MKTLGLIGAVLCGLVVVGIGLLLVRFSQHDSEAAEDRENDCEHRSAPVHDERGILICPDCKTDLEA